MTSHQDVLQRLVNDQLKEISMLKSELDQIKLVGSEGMTAERTQEALRFWQMSEQWQDEITVKNNEVSNYSYAIVM